MLFDEPRVRNQHVQPNSRTDFLADYLNPNGFPHSEANRDADHFGSDHKPDLFGSDLKPNDEHPKPNSIDEPHICLLCGKLRVY